MLSNYNDVHLSEDLIELLKTIYALTQDKGEEWVSWNEVARRQETHPRLTWQSGTVVEPIGVLRLLEEEGTKTVETRAPIRLHLALSRTDPF